MVSSQARFLKLESHGDLRAVHRDLIDEAGGILVHIKKPIANLRKDVPSDLAPDCGTGPSTMISHGGVGSADGCTLTGAFSNLPACPETTQTRKIPTKTVTNGRSIFQG